MTALVSGLAGYNYYLSDGGSPPNYTKLNDTPIADNVDFTTSDLTPNTDYSSLLFVTAVDNAGNETAKVSYAGKGARTLSPTPAETLMDSTRTAAIDALVARCMAAGAGPAVSVGITSPYGYYYQSYGTGSDVSSHFRIASQAKTMVGYVIMRLVDQGLLNLSDNLSQHLSGYAVDPTIQQMMMMQSGIYDYELDSSLMTSFEISPTTAETVDQLLAVIKAGTPGRTSASEFVPGTKYYYTNSNYFILARLAETLDPSGRTIDQIFQQDLFAPLGMGDTYLQTVTGAPTAPYVKGYDYNPILSIFGIKSLRDVSSQNPNWVWASGGVISNVVDLVKWGAEMRDGTLISTTSKNLMMNNFAEQPESPAWGLGHTGPPTFGYGLGRVRVGSWYGHDGSWPGYDGCIMFEPVTGSVICVFENFQTVPSGNSLGLPLLAMSLVWYEIVNYLYPNSANQLGFDNGAVSTGSSGSTLKKLTTASAGAVYSAGTIIATMGSSLKKLTSSAAGSIHPVVVYSATDTAATGNPPVPTVTVNSGEGVVIWLQIQSGGSSSPSCSIGTVSIPLLGGAAANSTLSIYAFGAPAGIAPVGTNQTITFTGPGTGGAAFDSAGAITYANLVSFGSVVTANGNGSPSVANTGNSGELIAVGFTTTGTISASSGTPLTNRINLPTASFVNDALYVGDAPGTGSAETFTAVCTSAWAGIAVQVKAT